MSTPTARPPQIPPDPSMPSDSVRPEVPPSVKGQLLATEHWSLLASRTTTQNEVLTGISMFLTLVSAALVSLALVGQAIGFSETFSVFAVAVLGVVSLVGVLTELRVMNVAFEDPMYVVAMNRVRGEYAEIDPDVSHAASVTVSVVVGIVCGVVYLAATSARGARRYFAIWKSHTPRFPTPTTGDA